MGPVAESTDSMLITFTHVSISGVAIFEYYIVVILNVYIFNLLSSCFFCDNLYCFNIVSKSIRACQSCNTPVIEYSALEESIKFCDGFAKTFCEKIEEHRRGIQHSCEYHLIIMICNSQKTQGIGSRIVILYSK